MPNNFFDTSALGKHFHSEIGTPKVDVILYNPGSRHYISRLGAVEILSVYAGKVRSGLITPADFELLRKRFTAELAGRFFLTVRILAVHFQAAQSLIQRHALTQRLRTLDALQLAVALDQHGKGLIDRFICVDKVLCTVAASEGLAVIDPEAP